MAILKKYYAKQLFVVYCSIMILIIHAVKAYNYFQVMIIICFAIKANKNTFNIVFFNTQLYFPLCKKVLRFFQLVLILFVIFVIINKKFLFTFFTLETYVSTNNNESVVFKLRV